MIYLQEIQAECGRIAKEKGWDDEPVDFGMTIALIHSELSEALEEYRDGRNVTAVWYRESDKKPLGIPTELADTIIRILHFCSVEGINIEPIILEKLEYNATREY